MCYGHFMFLMQQLRMLVESLLVLSLQHVSRIISKKGRGVLEFRDKICMLLTDRGARRFLQFLKKNSHFNANWKTFRSFVDSFKKN